MEHLTFLGTGAAMVTKCYNACFTIADDDGDMFLVDGGGGNGILTQLERLGYYKANKIRSIFVSHNHSDHILGVVWVVRAITQEMRKGRYEGNLTIYAHPRSLEAVRVISSYVMQPRLNAFFDKRVIFQPIADGEEYDINDRHFRFFDIKSTKELQHGFVCTLHSGQRLAYTGDEPIKEQLLPVLAGTDVLVQEAYCAARDEAEFKPFEKSHGTAEFSCRNAARIGASATILFHTEGRNLETRRQTYIAEGRAVYNGKIFVPDDLDDIKISDCK